MKCILQNNTACKLNEYFQKKNYNKYFKYHVNRQLINLDLKFRRIVYWLIIFENHSLKSINEFMKETHYYEFRDYIRQMSTCYMNILQKINLLIISRIDIFYKK